MESDQYEEDMEDIGLDEKIEHHWRMVFKDRDGEVGD